MPIYSSVVVTQTQDALTTAQVGYEQANDAFAQANSAFTAANNRVLKVGDTMTGELNVANTRAITTNGNVIFTSNVFDTPILTVTSNTHLADNAAGKIVFVSSTSNVTINIAAAAREGFSYTIVRGNTGNVTIANSTAVTRLNSSSILSFNIAQYGAATVIYTATNRIILVGDFSPS